MNIGGIILDYKVKKCYQCSHSQESIRRSDYPDLVYCDYWKIPTNRQSQCCWAGRAEPDQKSKEEDIK